MGHPAFRGSLSATAYLLAVLFSSFFVKNSRADDRWVSLNSGSVRNFRSLYFTSATVGYVVGDSGAVLKTTDAGTHWTPLNSGTFLPLYSVCFPTADTGYVAGGGGVGSIRRTVNAGQTWDSLPAGNSTISFMAIRFTSSRVGYAAGGVETIISTTDAGAHWTLKPREGVMVGNFESIFAVDSTTVYVAGGNGYIFKTINAGKDWTYASISNWISSIFFITPQKGYCCGNYNSVYTTIDEGASWTNTRPTGNDWENAVWFTDTNTGYISGSARIFRTANAGASWDSMYTGVSGVALYSLFFTDANTGYAAGTGGTILKLTLPASIAAPIRNGSAVPSFQVKSGTVTCPQGTLNIYTMDGRRILSRDVRGTVDINRLRSGAYIIEIRTRGYNLTKKLVRL